MNRADLREIRSCQHINSTNNSSTNGSSRIRQLHLSNTLQQCAVSLCFAGSDMAGDWMKIELELPDKPEVHSIAGMLNIDPDAVVGKLIRIWQWFDKHTTDGNAYGVTFSLPDRISGVSGFGESMAFVGWLEQHDKTLVMPRFDRHTSKSAKARALGAKRVADFKGKSNAEGNGVSVTEALPREEKRREYKNTSSPDKPDDGFAEFWKAYPRKVGKGAALKAWSKIKSKAETLQMILKALDWQRSCEQWVKNGGQFIPHPGTWLNEQRWLDEQPNQPVAEQPRPAITLETRREAMQAQADEGYKIRKWLDGERRYRTVFRIEGESIKATKEYESEVMA